MTKKAKSTAAGATPRGGKAKPRPKKQTPTPARVRQVVDWIVEGQAETTIAEAIRSIYRATNETDFIAAAYVRLGELADEDPELRRAWHIATRRELYRRTFEIHDFKTSRDILRDLAQLEGLYPPAGAAKRPAAGTAEPPSQGEEGIPTADGFPRLV